MRYVLVSACLMGVNCKYSAGNNACRACLDLLSRNDLCLIPICPEQLGGLQTPRACAERAGNTVINKNGEDVTPQFHRGAEEALRIAKQWHCQEAILKERSPSCGSSVIYDGTFSGTVIPGKGLTAELLEENGIKIMNEFCIEL